MDGESGIQMKVWVMSHVRATFDRGGEVCCEMLAAAANKSVA